LISLLVSDFQRSVWSIPSISVAVLAYSYLFLGKPSRQSREFIFLLLHCSSHGPRESQFWLTETLFSFQIPFSVWLIIRKRREMIRKRREIDPASRDLQISWKLSSVQYVSPYLLKNNSASTRVWTGNLQIHSLMLYHWAILPYTVPNMTLQVTSKFWS
jgi:hypothetical protein